MVLMIGLVYQKKISINFSKSNTTLCLSLHYNGDESYLYVNQTKICKFKANNNISWFNFSLGNILKDFAKDEQRETSFNDPVFDFPVDHILIKFLIFTNS